MAAPRSPTLIAGWKGGVVVASHDRALLEGMDRIVELTPVGCRLVAGGWSDFVAVRDAERAAAASELDRAEAGMRQTERAVQDQRERKARRDKAGRAFGKSGSAPKIVIGAMKRRAENTAARYSQLAERMIGDAAADHVAARARVEMVTPLNIALPPSGLSSGRELLRIEGAVIARGERRIGPVDLAIRGPERVALSGPNGAGKTSVLALAAGTLEPVAGSVWRSDRIALFDQHVGLLDRGSTILANLRAFSPRPYRQRSARRARPLRVSQPGGRTSRRHVVGRRTIACRAGVRAVDGAAAAIAAARRADQPSRPRVRSKCWKRRYAAMTARCCW